MGREKNNPSTHFTCVKCGRERHRRSELSGYSKKAIKEAERIGHLSDKERAKLEFCHFCVNESMASGNMPKALAAWLAKEDAARERERKVTPEEAGETRQPGPVHEDRLLTYDEAASISGIPRGTLTFWAHSGTLPKTYIGEGKRSDVRIKLSDLLKVLEDKSKDGKYEHPRRQLKQSHYLSQIATAMAAKVDALQLTQAAAAKQIGVSPTTVSDVISGRRKWVTPQIFAQLKRWAADYMPETVPANGNGVAHAPVEPPAPEPAPAPVEAPRSDKLVVVQPVVVDDTVKSMAPWEAEAELKRRQEVETQVAERVEVVLAEKVKPLEDRIASLELANEGVLEWLGKYRQSFPDWSGWSELDEILQGAQEVVQ